jgi:hypothetical protein
MANVPKYDTRNFSFGPGILYLSPYDVTNDRPTYPNIDVGAVRAGAVLRISRDILDVMQGSPDLIVKSFVKSETVEFNINSIEWKLENLYTALGGGELSTTNNKIRFGGDMDLDLYTLRFEHTTPNGDTWIIKIWKANPTGSLEISFGNDDVHQFALNFRGLKSFYGFDLRSQNIGTGNGTTTSFSATLNRTPVVANSVEVYLVTSTATTLAGKDNGTGSISGPLISTGTINYDTGAISVTFTSAPPNGSTIRAVFSYYVELPQTASIVEIEKIPAS